MLEQIACSINLIKDLTVFKILTEKLSVVLTDQSQKQQVCIQWRGIYILETEIVEMHVYFWKVGIVNVITRDRDRRKELEKQKKR